MSKPSIKTLLAATMTTITVVGFAYADDDLHLHPVEQYRISYEQTGMMEGTIERGCRNWCNEQVEINDTSLSMMGITQKTHTRALTIRDKIYSVNLETGKTTVTQNPMYGIISQQLQDSGNDPQQVAQTWLDAMGLENTGNTRTIAGETCT